MTRRELCARSGVAESTIKRFESTGEMGARSLVMILMALGLSDQMESLFMSRPTQTIDDLLRPSRRRGRRADAGKKRGASLKHDS